jgi:hypothetical protein
MHYCEGMGLVQAKIQTVEDIYRLVWTAVASKRPMEARYHGRHRRLFCPHRLGRNWRCIAVEKPSKVKLLEDTWRTAPNHSRPASCVIDADIDAEDHPERDPQKGH